MYNTNAKPWNKSAYPQIKGSRKAWRTYTQANFSRFAASLSASRRAKRRDRSASDSYSSVNVIVFVRGKPRNTHLAFCGHVGTKKTATADTTMVKSPSRIKILKPGNPESSDHWCAYGGLAIATHVSVLHLPSSRWHMQGYLNKFRQLDDGRQSGAPPNAPARAAPAKKMAMRQ